MLNLILQIYEKVPKFLIRYIVVLRKPEMLEVAEANKTFELKQTSYQSPFHTSFYL
jgi:hypothetical protein